MQNEDNCNTSKPSYGLRNPMHPSRANSHKQPRGAGPNFFGLRHQTDTKRFSSGLQHCQPTSLHRLSRQLPIARSNPEGAGFLFGWSGEATQPHSNKRFRRRCIFHRAERRAPLGLKQDVARSTESRAADDVAQVVSVSTYCYAKRPTHGVCCNTESVGSSVTGSQRRSEMRIPKESAHLHGWRKGKWHGRHNDSKTQNDQPQRWRRREKRIDKRKS